MLSTVTITEADGLFYYFRLDRLSTVHLKNLTLSRNSTSTPLHDEEVTRITRFKDQIDANVPFLITPFTKHTSEGHNNAQNVLWAMSGSLEAKMAAVVSKMADARVTHVVPVVFTSSFDRHLAEFDIFRDVASELAPKIGVARIPIIIKSPRNLSISNQSVNGLLELKLATAHIDVQLRRLPAPSTALLIFGDGPDVSLMLSQTLNSAINGNNSKNGSTLARRPWYFPDAYLWENELKSNESTWRMARDVGLFSVMYLGQNYATTFR